jgi:hypothetical protein
MDARRWQQRHKVVCSHRVGIPPRHRLALPGGGRRQRLDCVLAGAPRRVALVTIDLEPRFLDEPCVDAPRQDVLMVDFPAGSFDLIARQAWR